MRDDIDKLDEQEEFFAYMQEAKLPAQQPEEEEVGLTVFPGHQLV